jgi:L-rhamnose mutarotase
MAVQRYGMVIQVKPEKLALYRALHADPWPEVLATITACHIRNYSIYLKDNYLFSFFEYVGDDFAADMAKMAADPKTQEWWTLTDSCQEPLESRAPGEWWAKMEEVFHHD